MQGVEILTSTQVVVEKICNPSVFGITFGIIFGLFTIVGIWLAIDYDIEWSSVPLVMFGGVICGALMGSVFGEDIFPESIVYETQYEVTISDEVSMTEFCEHYKVIDQDDKIFTVREKTNEEHK